MTVDSLIYMKESTLRESSSLIDPSVSRLKFAANQEEKALSNLRTDSRYVSKVTGSGVFPRDLTNFLSVLPPRRRARTRMFTC